MSVNLTNLTVRTKFRAAICIWFIGGPILILMTIYITKFFLIPLIGLQFLLGGYTMLLRCPKCSKPVLHNTVEIFGIKFNLWTSWIPKQCSKCGIDLE